jgi:hypothetical protein
MGGILKAAGLGDGLGKFANTIAKLRLALPHDYRQPYSSLDV